MSCVVSGCRSLLNPKSNVRFHRMFYYTPHMYLLFAIGCISAAPADEPIRVDLPVYDQPLASSDVHLAHALESENYGGVKSNHEKLIDGNLLSHKLHAATGVLGNKFGPVHAKENLVAGGVFSAPVTTREDALLETEGWGSKTLSIKENVHNIVAGFFQPKPIVDTIREEEKYGNSGDKFYTAGRALVGGAEGVSNLVNTVLEVPSTIFKKITRAATEKLNNLGGRLIGLN